VRRNESLIGAEQAAFQSELEQGLVTTSSNISEYVDARACVLCCCVTYVAPHRYLLPPTLLVDATRGVVAPRDDDDDVGADDDDDDTIRTLSAASSRPMSKPTSRRGSFIAGERARTATCARSPRLRVRASVESRCGEQADGGDRIASAAVWPQTEATQPPHIERRGAGCGGHECARAGRHARRARRALFGVVGSVGVVDSVRTVGRER
jgi:hypothetical protein